MPWKTHQALQGTGLPTRPRADQVNPEADLKRQIRGLNSDYNLGIVTSENDVVYQRLQQFSTQNKLNHFIKEFATYAASSRTLEKWKEHDPTRTFPRALTRPEREQLRGCLIRCAGDFETAQPQARSFPGALPSTSYPGPAVVPIPTKAVSFPSHRPSVGLDPSTAFRQNTDGTFDTREESNPPPACQMLRKKRPSDGARLQPSPEKRQCRKGLGKTITATQDSPPSPTQANDRVWSSRVPSSSAYSVSDDIEMQNALWESAENIDQPKQLQEEHDTYDGGDGDDETEETASFVTSYEMLDPEPLSDSTGCDDKVRDRVVKEVGKRLENNIWPGLPDCMKSLPFPVIWEVARVAKHCGLTLAHDTMIDVDLAWKEMPHRTFWRSLKELDVFKDKPFPEPSDSEAWEAALGRTSSTHRGVQYSAKGEFPPGSPSQPLFRVTLSPIRLELTHRLGRQFGPEKFLEVLFPTLEHKTLPVAGGLRDHGDAVVEKFVEWITSERHVLLGKRWSAFFIKDATKKTNFKRGEFGSLTSKTDFMRRYYMFREDTEMPKLRRHDVVNWLLQLKSNTKNHKQPYLKLFSRITLGVSRTRPTVAVRQDQIKHMEKDVLSEAIPNEEQVVMNDGCARMSRGLARQITEHLGLDFNPCAFQGRFGSAKGMWVVDVMGADEDEDAIWIETYPSQRKWICDYRDENQRTFDVRDYAPCTIQSASVNTQLLPVLEHGAIDRNKMREDLAELIRRSIEQELAKQEVAMQTPNEALLWINQLRKPAVSRLEASVSDGKSNAFGPLLGSFPDKTDDQIAFLVQQNFHPQEQKLIQDLAKKARDDHCARMLQELKFQVGCSGYFFMIADMWGVLKEGEVHVCFADVFQDEATHFSDTMLDDCDVLVSRSPAHLPSDVQRAKAVFCRQLRKLKNVVVFSTKGSQPLADKLSGGDYDGDLAWVCWDQNLARNFSNSAVPECPTELSLRKEEGTYRDLMRAKRTHKKSVANMIQRGLQFNCQGSSLGRMTAYKEQVCYQTGEIASKPVVLLSHLLGLLVDQAKQGTIFTMDDFVELRKSQGLPPQNQLVQPAFKDKALTEWRKKGEPFPKHVCDYLRFVVAKQAIDAGRARFNKILDQTGATYRDNDLVMWSDRLEKKYPSMHKQLKEDLYSLRSDWDDNSSGRVGAEWRGLVRNLHWDYHDIKPLATDGVDLELLEDLGMPGNNILSTWSLCKASTLFKITWSSNRTATHHKFLWHMCGQELGIIKVRASGNVSVLVGDCHAILKVDKKAVARQTGRLIGVGEDLDVYGSADV
ncbi:hypothetical protein MKZ38_009309 [Zalerion maritima]|uniref:RNA-dependent RNA polymerase n=1 Tax=Zalerion maritima TaxID=339359 RepID=A0AAD5RTL6_9PEZI|nr:hypothetical protein MKZ38_009309 [Zalerion maritima]